MSPSKRAFEKYKPWGLFSEFYVALNKSDLSKLNWTVKQLVYLYLTKEIDQRQLSEC